jgi:hypothetical protein
MAVWPASWPVLPHITIDLLIIWTSFFAPANYHVIREDGRNIFSHIYVIENNLMKSQGRAIFNTIIKTITIFLVGPVLYPALAIADFKRARGKGQLVITNWIVMKPRAILWYVAQQIGLINVAPVHLIPDEAAERSLRLGAGTIRQRHRCMQHVGGGHGLEQLGQPGFEIGALQRRDARVSNALGRKLSTQRLNGARRRQSAFFKRELRDPRCRPIYGSGGRALLLFCWFRLRRPLNRVFELLFADRLQIGPQIHKNALRMRSA